MPLSPMAILAPDHFYCALDLPSTGESLLQPMHDALGYACAQAQGSWELGGVEHGGL